MSTTKATNNGTPGSPVAVLPQSGAPVVPRWLRFALPRFGTCGAVFRNALKFPVPRLCPGGSGHDGGTVICPSGPGSSQALEMAGAPVVPRFPQSGVPLKGDLLIDTWSAFACWLRRHVDQGAEPRRWR